MKYCTGPVQLQKIPENILSVIDPVIKTAFLKKCRILLLSVLSVDPVYSRCADWNAEYPD